MVVVPYEAHECLRSHRGVDLTGKPRVWLSPIFSIDRRLSDVKSGRKKAERRKMDSLFYGGAILEATLPLTHNLTQNGKDPGGAERI